MQNNKVITSKITNKDITIKIPKKFIINDFNDQVEDFKIKGNKKTEFIKEFSKLLIEYMENNDVIVDIYDQLCDTDLVKEIDD